MAHVCMYTLRVVVDEEKDADVGETDEKEDEKDQADHVETVGEAGKVDGALVPALSVLVAALD